MKWAENFYNSLKNSFKAFEGMEEIKMPNIFE